MFIAKTVDDTNEGKVTVECESLPRIGERLVADSPFGNVLAGKWVCIEEIRGKWVVVSAEC